MINFLILAVFLAAGGLETIALASFSQRRTGAVAVEVDLHVHCFVGNLLKQNSSCVSHSFCQVCLSKVLTVFEKRSQHLLNVSLVEPISATIICAASAKMN